MAAHLSLMFQVVVVGIGVAATVVCIQRAIRSGREDHVAFVAFWTVFTLSLVVILTRDYIVTNVADRSVQTLLLLHAISVDTNLVLVVTVLRYLHRLGTVPGSRIRDTLALAGLLVSMVALGVPWGVEFDAAAATVRFRTGFWIGEAYYISGLLYAVVLSWTFVVRRPRNEAPAFLIVMALFATSGLLESAVGLVRAIANSTASLLTAPLIYSSIPYAVYGVFLIVNGRVEESAGPAHAVRLATGDENAGESTKDAAPEDEYARIQSAIERFGLSERERDVVVLVLDGRSNQEIADRLYVSLATVKTHLYRIYRKAAVPSRYGLIRAVGRSA